MRTEFYDNLNTLKMDYAISETNKWKKRIIYDKYVYTLNKEMKSGIKT